MLIRKLSSSAVCLRDAKKAVKPADVTIRVPLVVIDQKQEQRSLAELGPRDKVLGAVPNSLVEFFCVPVRQLRGLGRLLIDDAVEPDESVGQKVLLPEGLL